MWSLKLLAGCQPAADQSGLIIGCADPVAQTVLVLSCLTPTNDGGIKEAATSVQSLLPWGVWVLGSFSSSTSNSTSTAAPAAARWGVPVVGASVCDGFVTWNVANASLEPDVVPLTSTGAPSGYVLARCHSTIQVTAPTTASKDAIAAAVQAAEKQILNEATAYIPEQGWAKAPQCFTSTPSSTSSSTTASQALVPAAAGCLGVSLIPLQATSSSSSSSASGPASAPMFEYHPNSSSSSSSSASVALNLDVVCYIPASAPADRLAADYLTPALIQQLQHIRSLFQQQQIVTPLQCLHFQPPGCTHLVTCCYPQLSPDSNTAELKLAATRKQLHEVLGLPTNVPLLRQANALQWQLDSPAAAGAGAAKAARLQNVHLTLPLPQLGGTTHIISGHYDYYHYMQDRFNDAGWGCAYRSLQTIISWFQQQRYTAKPVPSHREIQQTLVKLGDKDTSFVGSSNWIGAIELSYILDEYLGITSKILTVNRGSDIPSHARQLAAHFDSQGTPVMIGGGVLAYTLLGVHFNEATGECAFLILDPHYTGGEDLKKIQSGTWVAWKRPGDSAAAGGPLFVDTAFYNFLCPQRPSTV